MSHILTYLMIGVVINFIYDWLVNYTGEEYRLTIKERIMTGLAWPIVLIIFIYNFIKTFLTGRF